MSDIQADVAIDGHFADDQLDQFVSITPRQEQALRNAMQVCIYGSNPVAVKDLIKNGPSWHPELPNTGGTGHPGVDLVRAALVTAIGDYNALNTGLTFTVSDGGPTCVRYEWRDGELVAIYNYSLATSSDESGTCPPPGPPQSDFHAVLVYTIPE